MKIVAIIQARMGSTRLPGKVMKTLGDQTVLAHVVTRVRACPLVDEVMVATTTFPQDGVIREEAQKQGVRTFRGSGTDVLSRYYGAARQSGAEVVVRVTSDCPLFDPLVLEAMLRRFREIRAGGRPLDYLSNALEDEARHWQRTFPRGLDAEIFTWEALAWAHQEGVLPYQREHVTPYIYQHPELFDLENFASPVNLSHHRWTLDTPEDWLLMEAVYEALYQPGSIFTTQAVLDLLAARPELPALNAHVEQKKLET